MNLSLALGKDVRRGESSFLEGKESANYEGIVTGWDQTNTYLKKRIRKG